MSEISGSASAFDPRRNKALTIVMGTLLWGMAWQIRGNGTSNPSAVILLFLLFLAIHYAPRQKFNLFVFGLAVLVFRLMRTGWGTLVGQAGIPGLYPGHITPDGAELARQISYDIVVPWWHGYFWLVIVGFAWAGLPSLIFGGYFFTRLRYGWKDVLVCLALFIVGRQVGVFLAEQFIPWFAAEYYQQIYLPGISQRNYISMRGNLSTALAILPVIAYIYFGRKDRAFARRSLTVTAIFGAGLALAAFWHPIGRNNPQWNLPAWSLWEYFSGFFIGGLLFWFYSRFSEQELQETDLPGPELSDSSEPIRQFLLGAAALYAFVLYSLADSMAGSLRITSGWLGVEPPVSARAIEAVVVGVALVLYYFYRRGWILSGWAALPFRAQCLVAFLALLPVNYLLFLAPFIVTGRLALLNSPAWLDTISFAVVEIYAIYLYNRFRRSPARLS